MKEFLEKFVAHLQNQGRARATAIAYHKDLDQLIAYLESIGKTNLYSVSTVELNGFLTKLAKEKYTPKSISRKLNSLKTFYKYLLAEGVINEDTAKPLAHPKLTIVSPRILTPLEYRALRDSCRDDERMAAVVEILLQTGVRIGELAALQLDHVTNEGLIVPPLEAHPGRTIPLNKAARAALERYLATRPRVKVSALFVTKTGRPLLIRNMRTSIDRYFRLAGIKDAKVNDLRHTFIAHHLAAGTSPVVVSQLVGHKRISTTEKYLEYIQGLDLDKNKLEEL